MNFASSACAAADGGGGASSSSCAHAPKETPTTSTNAPTKAGNRRMAHPPDPAERSSGRPQIGNRPLERNPRVVAKACVNPACHLLRQFAQFGHGRRLEQRVD